MCDYSVAVLDALIDLFELGNDQYVVLVHSRHDLFALFIAEFLFLSALLSMVFGSLLKQRSPNIYTNHLRPQEYETSQKGHPHIFKYDLQCTLWH